MYSAAAVPVTISPEQPVPPEFDLLCEGCDYSLVGLMVDRCPECGRPFDPALLPLARVPWLYRRRLGSLRTYRQTVALVLRRPRVFSRELCRPVRISESDARAFRARTIRIAATAVLIPIIAAVYQQWAMLVPIPRWAIGVVSLMCLLSWFAVSLWMWMSTDLPTFIWRGLPGRSDDLSPLHHYACAPLALMPIPAILIAVGLLVMGNAAFDPRGGPTAATVLIVLALLLPIALAAWVIPLVLMRTATGCGAGRVLLLAVYLPLHWAMMAFLIFGIGVVLAIILGAIVSGLM